MSYDYHRKNYEHYERLLLSARAEGNRSQAAEAARMLLFHLRSLFHALPASRRHAVRSTLATRAA